MKHEWKKHEKQYYMPKSRPEQVNLPAFRFFTIKGEGNPNAPLFASHIEVLYALSYAVRMSPKKNMAPEGYFEYTVYPLEGIWDLREDAKKDFNGSFSKEDLVYRLMIRQPDFVDEEYATGIKEFVRKNKSLDLVQEVNFEIIEEGDCIQMLHLGSYDSEPESFRLMEEFAANNGLKRKSKIHREIYLTDARKTVPEKQKTVLRFKV